MTVMPIERGKIREYALATANDRPEYMDDPRASIPPTFLATVIYWASIGGGRSPEAEQLFAELGITPDWRSLLSAEQEYVFHGPLPRAGDELVVSSRSGGAEVKQGRRGPMVFVRSIVEFRNPDDGSLVAECIYTSAYLSDTPAA